MNESFRRKEKATDILCIIFVISVFAMWIFSLNETFRHLGILSDYEEMNTFGVVVILAILGFWAVSQDIKIASFIWIISILNFFIFVYFNFQEINMEQYKKIENIDKATIKSFIGEKDYVNVWDYLNILENKEKENRNNALKIKEKELEEDKG